MIFLYGVYIYLTLKINKRNNEFYNNSVTDLYHYIPNYWFSNNNIKNYTEAIDKELRFETFAGHAYAVVTIGGAKAQFQGKYIQISFFDRKRSGLEPFWLNGPRTKDVSLIEFFNYKKDNHIRVQIFNRRACPTCLCLAELPLEKILPGDTLNCSEHGPWTIPNARPVPPLTA